MNLTPRDYVSIGIFVAGVWYLRRDMNGIGAKTRKMVAEIIIMSKDNPDFAAIVRRLLG